MAAKALSGNSLLVVPTGCGKTKVIAMVLDDMWRSNPAAKVHPSLFSVNFFLSCGDISN
jgi:ERCC4-related helicase